MSKATTEIEVQVSGAKITSDEVQGDSAAKLTAQIVLPENKKKVANEVTVKKPIVSDDVLELVEASKLSLQDKFMQYEPEGGTNEAKIKAILTEVIQSGVSDFLRPKMDPSFDETGESICYVAGKRPAVGKPKKWWKKTAEKVGLQEGTKKQYVAFLGYLIKKSVEEGYDVSEAWYSICGHSKDLQYYEDKNDFEMTGSRGLHGFYDLGNTFKILVEDEEEKSGGFWIAGGLYVGRVGKYPMSVFGYFGNLYAELKWGVGWLVRNLSTDN